MVSVLRDFVVERQISKTTTILYGAKCCGEESQLQGPLKLDMAFREDLSKEVLGAEFGFAN